MRRTEPGKPFFSRWFVLPDATRAEANAVDAPTAGTAQDMEGAMKTERIEAARWKRFFDDVSRALPASKVDVVITGLDLGAQPGATHAPLVGLTYDSADDAFEITMRDFGHRISEPVSIYVERDSQGLHAIEVTDREGHKHIVKLTHALALPPS
jgi:hypothetical protein